MVNDAERDHEIQRRAENIAECMFITCKYTCPKDLALDIFAGIVNHKLRAKIDDEKTRKANQKFVR